MKMKMKNNKKKRITTKRDNINNINNLKGGSNVDLRPTRVKKSSMVTSRTSRLYNSLNLHPSIKRFLKPIEKFEKSCNIEYEKDGDSNSHSHSHSHSHNKIKVPFHCYGKNVAKLGRKMGHISLTDSDQSQLVTRIQALKFKLNLN